MPRRGTMRWDNLLENKCPSCGFEFVYFNDDSHIICNKCDYSIRTERMEEICSDLAAQKTQKELDKQTDEWLEAHS